MSVSRPAATTAPRLALLLLLLPSVLLAFFLPPPPAAAAASLDLREGGLLHHRSRSPRREALQHDVPPEDSYLEEVGTVLDPVLVRAMVQLLSSPDQPPRQAPHYPRLPLLPEPMSLPHKRNNNQYSAAQANLGDARMCQLNPLNCKPRAMKKSDGPSYLRSHDALLRRISYMLGGNLDQNMDETGLV